MRLLLITLCLLVISLSALGIDLLSEDAALTKPVTLDLKGESLTDITKVLSKATGLSVRASADVSDQKATILVDNMPLRDVMNGLATLYGWSWAVKSGDDGNTYIIYDPLRKKREADRKEALDNAWKALAARLDSLSIDERNFDSQDNPEILYKKLALLQYRALSPEVREAFLSGMLVRFDSDSPEPGWQTSRQTMDVFLADRNQIQECSMIIDGNKINPNSLSYNLSVILSSSANSDTVKAESVVRYTSRHDTPSGGSMSVTTGCGDKIELCAQEIDYPSENLENILPNEPTDESFAQKVSISASEAAVEGAIIDEETDACYATRTDLLAALHSKLGLQVISDYYSSWGHFEGIEDITLKQLLEEKQLPGFAFDWGWDGKILYTRVEDIRTADSREIPNRLLRRWQAAVKRQGYRDIDELAEAALLGDEQKKGISENCRYLKLGECKEISEYGSRDNTLLRFYGLLTPKQKKELFAGEVGVIELTQIQKEALAALINSAFGIDETNVGIYTKDGLDLDEPNVVRVKSGAAAVSAHMIRENRFDYAKPESTQLFFAATLEDALAEAQTQFRDDFDPRNMSPVNELVYKLTLQYDDSVNSSAGCSSYQLMIKVPDLKGKS